MSFSDADYELYRDLLSQDLLEMAARIANLKQAETQSGHRAPSNAIARGARDPADDATCSMLPEDALPWPWRRMHHSRQGGRRSTV